MVWEVDWSHPENNGSRVWARNLQGRKRSARVWHWTATGYLRQYTDLQRGDYGGAWEFDWSRRSEKAVMARNIKSRIPSARIWHWVSYSAAVRANVKWVPMQQRDGRSLNKAGYVVLSRLGMTPEEIDLAERHDLFRGAVRRLVLEHQLVAVKKYGSIVGRVVRHVNGLKADNRPENLVLGTTQENTRDHDSARVMAMYWRERWEHAQSELMRLYAVAAVQLPMPT